MIHIAAAPGAAVHTTVRSWANAATLVVVLVANGLAGNGALSGRSIGELAQAYPNYFLPAGWVFGIWSLIYAGLAAFAVYQVLPSRRHDAALVRLGWGWVVNGALNTAWVVLFSYGRFGWALLVMVALLANLVVVTERIGVGRIPIPSGDRWLVGLPFRLYLAWISVALIANAFHYAVVIGWSGLGVPEVVWAPVMMVAATLLGALMTAHRGAWIFPLVVAWALLGIRARVPDVPPVAVSATVMAVTSVVLLPAALWWHRRMRPAARGARMG